jgi:RNA polymerase sigma-70 factor, ECF subfamily
MEAFRIDPLARALVTGADQAFSTLYDQFGQRLYRAAIGMLGCRQDAEDVVQEVFVAVFKSRQRLTDVQNITAYLFATLHHAAGRRARQRAQSPGLSEAAVNQATALSGTDPRPSPYHERLDRALLALPTEQREVIALKIDGELTFAQIAKVLGVNVNTAASRYRYALEKLRTSMKGLQP